MEESWSKILKKFPEANFLQSPLWAEANKLEGHKLVVRTLMTKRCFSASSKTLAVVAT